ncbi:Uncharacterised protein [Mycobacteroides abscessus subsp. abscessus]|nr:Uncharacterised protein [Mycobacteroides abscessus subsp. abscessus]SIC81450.1 Uncharacterised protein [Mycobacteroides abscessus subsp. abscessus]SKP25250.1 Uncharacterised protein [Mycobacteroides abscessus subsp. abscessus]
MKDKDVRDVLVAQLRDDHGQGSALIVEELGLRGGMVRVDVAVVDDNALSGFEIKSAADTLRRFPRQIEVYSKVLDYANAVVADTHLEHVQAVLPRWWGCQVVYTDAGGGLRFDEICPAAPNPGLDPYSLATLLWRDEVVDALQARDALTGVVSKPNRVLWGRLVEVLDVDELRALVRDRLRARTRWRQHRVSVASEKIVGRGLKGRASA